MSRFFDDFYARLQQAGENFGIIEPRLHFPRDTTPLLVGAVATVLLAVYAPGIMLWTAVVAALGGVMWAACHPHETAEFANRAVNSLNDLARQWGSM